MLTLTRKERLEAVTVRALAEGEPSLVIFVSDISRIPTLFHLLIDHREARDLFAKLCVGITVSFSKRYTASYLRELGFSEDNGNVI
jgi:hypothetical protein